VRIDQFISKPISFYFTGIKASAEMAQDETTEQVFSRKTDRRAYRAEVLGKRTAEAQAKPRRKKKDLGEEVKAGRKAPRAARSRA
jgi:hypothetical protein